MKISRLNAIEQFIILHDTVKIDDLCEAFSVSKNTIRRDLNELEARGHIAKVYGGVTSIKKIEDAYLIKNKLNTSSKMAIADLASAFVKDGDTIFVDSGTTAVHIIEFLSNKSKITVITHSLNVLSEASKYPNLNILSLGGMYIPDTGSFVGLATLETLDSIKINKAFMGASAMSIDNGFSVNTLLEAEIKKKIVSRSNEIYMMCDNSKFGKESTISFCKVNNITSLITDKRPVDDYLDYFISNNTSINYPKKNI